MLIHKLYTALFLNYTKVLAEMSPEIPKVTPEMVKCVVLSLL